MRSAGASSRAVKRLPGGSDYCFDMGLTAPVGTVEHLSAVSDDERDLILGTTAAKLLRL